jgi:NDP-sugar pyrophosphorylase family protein
MYTAVILAAGKGTKIWPYDSFRPKCLLPIVNIPLVKHQVDRLKQCGATRIIIAAPTGHPQIARLFAGDRNVEVIPIKESRGTADTLVRAFPDHCQEPVWVLYGDCWVDTADLQRLKGLASPGALITRHREPSRNHIGCAQMDGKLTAILGHSRDKTTHHFLAFTLLRQHLPFFTDAPPRFPKVDVGMMVPEETFLEAGLLGLMDAGIPIKAIEAKGFALDIDKPWHLLEVNTQLALQQCSELKDNQLLAGASIDPSAKIHGKVRLGKGSSIGRNVIVEGNIWVGDNTQIDTGAFIRGNVVFGDDCEIGYGCYIESGSVVGDRCKVLHGAELSGLLFPNVYLYHYMEIAGVVGENTDLGAGTVCGSLRFDDAGTIQRIKGRAETLQDTGLANACYIGDQCRTGVNAILLPGVKMGSSSVLGPGVVLYDDLESNKMLLLKQDLVKKDWNTDKYGW